MHPLLTEDIKKSLLVCSHLDNMDESILLILAQYSEDIIDLEIELFYSPEHNRSLDAISIVSDEMQKIKYFHPIHASFPQLVPMIKLTKNGKSVHGHLGTQNLKNFINYHYTHLEGEFSSDTNQPFK